MDKNYNVDDILADIKRRKSREKGSSPQQRPAAPPSAANTAPPAERLHFASPGEDEGATTSFQPVRPPQRQQPPSPAASQQPSAPRQPSTPSGSETGGLNFSMPQGKERPQRGNPLDFDGHVRPLTDKAKIRRDRFSVLDGPPSATPPAPHRFDATAPVPPIPPAADGSTAVIDLAALRQQQGEVGRTAPVPVPPVSPYTDNRTRVLPKVDLGRSREFQLEDIQKLDFAAVAETYDSFDGYDEEYDSLDDIAPTAPPVDMSEYNSVGDRAAVTRDIAKVKLWLTLRLFATTVLCVILFYLTLAGRHPLSLPRMLFPETNPSMYMMSIAAFGVLTALVNSSSVGGGLISLFKMRANSDTLPALALLAATGQSIAAAVAPDAIDPTALGIYTCVAALSMLFNAFGKIFTIGRIQTNFRIISSGQQKYAVLPVESDDFTRQFIKDSSRRPTMAYSAKAGFFTDFLGLSYSDKYDVGINRGVAPACLLGALLVALLSYLLGRDSATSISAFTAILCVAATFSSSFLESIPLGKLAKKLAPQGGMVSGNKAVEDFCDTQAVILRERDFFPEGHIQLHGIKAYAHGRIDEAILDAASVMCATDSALSEVFLQMIGGNRKLLRKVDNLVYENGMGISAWVNSRRILIGTRQLMLSHGVNMTGNDNYKQKYAQQDGEVLYLSNSGEMAAQFVVSYHIDEALAAALDHLATAEKKLVVYTQNPHLTPRKIWELYGVPEDLVAIMPASMHGAYEDMAAPMETAPAEIAYTGSAAMMVRTLMACMNTRASILAATIIQLVQIILGYGLVAFIAFMGAMDTLNILQLTVYQAFWFVAIFIVQKARST